MDNEKELNSIDEKQESLNNNMINDKQNEESCINNNKESSKNKLESFSVPIFFFINPTSGSREGETVMSLAEKMTKDQKLLYHLIKCPIRKKESIDCVIANILNQDQMSAAIQLLQTLLSPNSPNEIKILIGGGDGTVLILIEDLQAKNINLTNCIFGHVPLGTGNDLSNALGFGNTVETQGDEECLFNIIKTYNSAKKCKVDVWNVKIVVEDTGKIIEINNEIESIKYDNNEHPLTVFSKTFINYLSLGYDARIGFSFSKQRSTNRITNKLIYFAKAAKKFFCCSKAYPIKNFISSFQVIDTKKIKLLPKKKNCSQSKSNVNKTKEINKLSKEKQIDDFDGLITDQDIGEFNTTSHIIFKSEEEKEDDDISCGSKPKRCKK